MIEQMTFITCIRKNDEVRIFKVDGYKIDEVYACFDCTQLKEKDLFSNDLIHWILCEHVYDNYYWSCEGFPTKNRLLHFYKTIYSLVEIALESDYKRNAERRRNLIEELKNDGGKL